METGKRGPSHGDELEDVEVTGDSATSSTDPAPREQSLTYLVMLRHLIKFRDWARAVRGLVAAHSEADASLSTAPAISATAGPESWSPLEQRIERHMASLDRAVAQLQDLNSDRKKQAELSSELCDQIAIKERTIRDIIGAELHFWAATIQNTPVVKLDEIERKWVARMLRLADIFGVDGEHTENFVFLKEWSLHRYE